MSLEPAVPQEVQRTRIELEGNQHHTAVSLHFHPAQRQWASLLGDADEHFHAHYLATPLG